MIMIINDKKNTDPPGGPVRPQHRPALIIKRNTYNDMFSIRNVYNEQMKRKS